MNKCYTLRRIETPRLLIRPVQSSEIKIYQASLAHINNLFCGHTTALFFHMILIRFENAS